MMYSRIPASWLWIAPFAALAMAAFALFGLRSPLYLWYEAVPVAVFFIALYRAFTGDAPVQLRYVGLMVWCVLLATCPLLYGAMLASH